MSEADDVEAVLAQVIDLGGRPTQQEMDLGEAVKALVVDQHSIVKVCPTCGGAGRIRTPGGEE